MRLRRTAAQITLLQNPVHRRPVQRKLQRKRSKVRRPNRNEKLFNRLPHEKDYLLSVAVGGILLLEFVAGRNDGFRRIVFAGQKQEPWKHRAARGINDDV